MYHRTDQIQDRTYSDMGLIRCRSTRRYYKTYTYTGVPVGTTGLIQIHDLSDTGVPVGTTEQISYGQNLIKCWSTRRYYRTHQIQDRTYSDTGHIRCRSTRRYYRTYSDTRLVRYRSTRRYYRSYSETGVPVGTTEQIQRYIRIFTLILYSESYHMSI